MIKAFLVVCLISLAIGVYAFVPLKEKDNALQVLQQAYPQQLKVVEANAVVMASGKRIAFAAHPNDELRLRDYEEWLNKADLQDQLSVPYVKGEATANPPINHDPGRARCEEFFEEVYGNSAAAVNKNCSTVQWIDGTALRVSTLNGVDKHLRAIVQELKQLPPQYKRFLEKPGGTFNWRSIAGTKRRSTHSYGIAIDINVAHSDYWRNAKPDAQGTYAYKNRIPMNIVSIFEKHGFIWGGKWYHYDTMHFEYRPELCKAECQCETK